MSGKSTSGRPGSEQTRGEEERLDPNEVRDPSARLGLEQVRDPRARLVLERKGNLFTRSPAGGRILSALSLPVFALLAPQGYGVLTTRGRRTGKTRRKCMHVIRHGDGVYMVMLRPTTEAMVRGWVAGWLWNIRADPNVRLRIRGGTFAGRARELTDPQELQAARAIYCDTVNLLDGAEYIFHRRRRPTRTKIEALHREWFDTGVPLVVELV